ncbi:hypothetical protein AM218_03855 [Hymenobacter sp. DG25A]|nr:hypothetical protein AM218_03855 [Hymenobacter sp. DG25A]
MQVGDEWTFEKAGQKMRYRVLDIDEQRHSKSSWGGFFGNSTYYYYDEAIVTIQRLDSAAYCELIFGRKPPYGAQEENPPFDKGRFYAAGRWDTYVGNINPNHNTWGLVRNILNFPPEPNSYRFTSLDINGKLYSKVMPMYAAATDPYPCTSCTQKQYIIQLYYDQQAGVIQLFDRKHEAWNRVP